jgi:hypothetical protein
VWGDCIYDLILRRANFVGFFFLKTLGGITHSVRSRWAVGAAGTLTALYCDSFGRIYT